MTAKKDILLCIINEPTQVKYIWRDHPIQIIKRRKRDQLGRFIK